VKFVNRLEELARLNRLLKSKTSAVAVIYGRRRVGKSRLILEWIRPHRGIYYMADESTPPLQRAHFAAAISKVLPGFSDVEYPDWEAFFSRLARDAIQAKWRGPLVIDELPYLIAASPELPSVLQRFIDTDAKKAKLIIALCGSSQRMMQGAILEPTSPLYGRAQEILKLRPISIGYLGQALKLKNSRAIVETYAIWGGIPRYWELLQKVKGSFFNKLDQIALDPMGPLHEEPSRLLLEESAMHLKPILDAIGMGNHRLSDVGTRIGLSTTSLVRPIDRLVELDLLQKEYPYGVDEQNSKRTLYKIKDPFLRFWFNVVASRRSWLSQVSPALRIQMVKKHLPNLFSWAWEELCRLAVPLMSKKLKGCSFGPAARFWQAQGPEWDVIAQSMDHKTTLIGEAKWFSKNPSNRMIQTLINELKNKGIPPIQRSHNGHTLYVLFLPEKPKKIDLPSDVIILDADDVIQAFRIL
jgi:AAA+ ATPase superfamily predicted ATPase